MWLFSKFIVRVTLTNNTKLCLGNLGMNINDQFSSGGLIKSLLKDPQVRFKFSELNQKIDGVL